MQKLTRSFLNSRDLFSAIFVLFFPIPIFDTVPLLPSTICESLRFARLATRHESFCLNEV